MSIYVSRAKSVPPEDPTWVDELAHEYLSVTLDGTNQLMEGQIDWESDKVSPGDVQCEGSFRPPQA